MTTNHNTHHEITRFEDARMALEEARMDVIADNGERMADDAHSDIVRVICERCIPEVAAELARREGVQL